jgi:HSP20 family protein
MTLPTRVSRGQYDPFDAAQREFDHMLGRWFGNRAGNEGGQILAPYGVDVREDQDHIYVEAELPGFRKDDIDITLENQTLTITAERSEEQRDQAPASSVQNRGNKQGQADATVNRPRGEYLLRERRYTRFQRSFTLPPTVDESTVNARLAEGVLTITLNKREETKPRKIQVS